MAESDVDIQIEAVRRFNRFYTQKIDVLNEGLLQSEFSLAEARVIYELAQRETGTATATALGGELGLDPGYLSRILSGFERRGLVVKQPSATDGRQTMLHLTPQGEAAFSLLDTRSREQIAALLNALPPDEGRRLVAAMRGIERRLSTPSLEKPPYLLRPHQPGDMGWVVSRHGVSYAREYGWDETFEALVAEMVAGFIRHYDPKRERCWMAEIDGEIVGSVFLVQKSETVAKLRLLLVEPEARGFGIGRRLVAECIRFARQAGYSTLTLWTNSILLAARHLYEDAGFHLVEAEPHHSFGHDLVGETWELTL